MPHGRPPIAASLDFDAERPRVDCSRDSVGHGRDAGRGRQAGAAAGDDAGPDDQRTAPP